MTNFLEGGRIYEKYIVFRIGPCCPSLVFVADELTGKKVLFHIDNLALVSIMNERS